MKSASHTSHDYGRASSEFLHQKQQRNKCLAAVALIKMKIQFEIKIVVKSFLIDSIEPMNRFNS